MSEDISEVVDPEHYKRLEPEPIEVIERCHLDYHAGQVVKYAAREGHKPGASAEVDRAKASWYLQRSRSVAPSEPHWRARTVVPLLLAAGQWRGTHHEVAGRIVDVILDELRRTSEGPTAPVVR